jgi:uncharacterized protein YjbI with pentapeptide repeats
LREALIEGLSKGANLRVADLQGADLQGAYLQDANLRGADLQGAYLQDANLQDADLQGAYGIIKIESQYKYSSYGYKCNGKLRVRLGCFDRTIEEWDSNFWNNEKEFPQDSPEGKNRFMIYGFIKTWLLENLK